MSILKKGAITLLSIVTLAGIGISHTSADTTATTPWSGTDVISNVMDVNGETVQTIGPVQTAFQLTESYSKDNGVTFDQAARYLGFSAAQLYGRAASYTYRTFSSQFTVTSSYKPSVTFYCKTEESGGFRGIVTILTVQMNRSYNGISKQFGGTVYANLEDPNRIYYIVNGDFYNNGTTTVNGGVNVGVGSSASVKFGVSSSSNHYAYTYKTGYVNF